MRDNLNVVFLDRGTFPSHVELPPFSFPHRLTVYEHTAPSEVLARIADAEIVVLNKVRIDSAILRKARRLKIMAVAATGTDIIDTAVAVELDIAVINVKGYAVNTVPEHAMALILALRRNIKAYSDSVADGAWARSRHFCFHDYPIRDLAGSNIGIVGRGALGQAVGRLAAAFGMNVSFASSRGGKDKAPGYIDFEEMLRKSDVISLHCPLTSDTVGMLGFAEFGMMERRPLVINTARGQLVDKGALIAALDKGLVSGVGLDVLSQEPPAIDDPLPSLARRPNVLITPHVAWASTEAMQALAERLCANIENAVGALTMGGDR